MRDLAFVPSEKRHREIGERRWTVTWYTLPAGWVETVPGEGPDPDELTSRQTYHCTRKAAIAAAEKVDDYFGSPVVQEEVVEWWVRRDNVASWEPVGEPIYVEPGENLMTDQERPPDG